MASSQTPVSTATEMALLSGRSQPTEAPEPTAAALAELRSQAAKLLQQTSNEARNGLLLGILNQIRSLDAAEAFRQAQTAKTPEMQQFLIKELAALWAKESYADAYAFGSSLPREPVGRRVQVAAMKVWAQVDAIGAIHFLASLSKEAGGDLIYFPAMELGKTNPEEAFDLLAEVKDREMWTIAAGQIFNAVASSDPKTAEKMFFDQQDLEVKIAFGYALGSRTARRSLPEGLRILNEITDYSTADHFLHGMLHYLAEGKENSLSMLPFIEQIKDPAIRENAADSALRGAVKWAPETAIQWADSLPADETRLRAYQGIGWAYAGKDLEAAQTWLSGLPVGKDRNYASFGFADANHAKNPALAAEWLLESPSAEGFGSLMRSSLQNWISQDQKSAGAWAQAHGVEKYLPEAR